jgi:hypothetical protein
MAHVATVTIDSDQVPADATNFPAYINLAHLFAGSASFASTVANGGGDIRVFQGATELAREVVSCDTSAETGELHVLIPFIDSSADTVLSIYADGSSADYAVDDPFGRNAVWGDYILVSHDLVTDSASSTTFTETGAGITSATDYFGNSGGAREFSGGTGYIDTGINTNATNIAIQMWTDPDSATGFGRLFSKNENEVGFLNGTQGVGYARSYTSGVSNVTDSNDNFSLRGWTRLTMTHAGAAGSDASFYFDATLQGRDINSEGSGTVLAPSQNWIIGNRTSDQTRGYDGRIHGFRVRDNASGTLSANWITTEYNNQSDPTSFYTATDPNAGGGESISPDSLYQSVSIEGVTLTQAHVLAAANLAQLQAIGAATLAQANSIAPHGVDQTAGIESATLTQAHIIAPAGISQHQQIGTASLVSAGVLSVFGLAQTQTLDEAILTVAGALDVDGVSQSQVLEALTLVQNNILAPAGLAQEAALEATTINAAALGITPAGIEQVMAIDPTGMTQYHVLAVSDLAQDQILEAARFGGLVIGELQGRIYVFAALDGDVYAIPALTGTIH